MHPTFYFDATDGEVPEWTMGLVLEAMVGAEPNVGSNPTLSARLQL